MFGTTLVAFFLAEMGDKTQVATVALAAQFHAFVSVVAGTTLGMMIANVPVVVLGDRIAQRLPVRPIRLIAAAVFVILGRGYACRRRRGWGSEGPAQQRAGRGNIRSRPSAAKGPRTIKTKSGVPGSSASTPPRRSCGSAANAPRSRSGVR